MSVILFPYTAESKALPEDSLFDAVKQAALSAGDYLDFQAFSEGGLRDQLDFEGFTPSQVDYAIAEMIAQGRL